MLKFWSHWHAIGQIIHRKQNTRNTIFISFCEYIYLANYTNLIILQFKRNSIDNWVVYTLLFSGIFHVNLDVLVSWFRNKSTQNMLNGWSRINVQFEKAFACPLSLTGLDNQLKRFSLTYFVVPLGICTIFGTANFVVSKLINGQELTIFIVRIFSAMYYNVGLLAVQLIYILICHMMSRMYDAIHYEILKQLPSRTNQKRHLESVTITRWKTILYTMQSQMEYIGDFISPTSIIMLIARVISLSTSIYTALLSFGNSREINTENQMQKLTGDYPITPVMATMMAWATILVTLVTQLLDVYFAEKIYQEVLIHKRYAGQSKF